MISTPNPDLPKHTVATFQIPLLTSSGSKKITSSVCVPRVGHNSTKLTLILRFAQKLLFNKCSVVQGNGEIFND